MATPAADSAERVADAATSAGEYRRRDGVSVVDGVVVSRRPLTATRLNDAAASLLRELDDGAFHTPETVASRTDHDAATVEQLFERLADREFLEWRPARDPDHRPPVSVVVTVRNDRDHLETCLEALADLDYPEYEVVVVDDGSTDGTRDLIASRAASDHGLRLVRVGDPDGPLGIGASRNRGVDAARHDTIAFTDADCRPRAAWLADLVPCLATADLVGGRVRPAGERAASAYEGVNASLDMGAYAARVDPAGNTPYLATANLVGRRELFEAVRFPDRNVAEDVDVCWRALDAGYEVVYTPEGVVEHAYRDDLRAFADRRATYGASEALLASEHDREDGSVGVPAAGLLVVALAVVGVAGSGAIGTAAFALAGVGVVLTAGVRGWNGWQRVRGLGGAVSSRHLLESWSRTRLSSAYALSQEVTRYYAFPVAAVAGLCWLAGAATAAAGTLAALAVAITLPAVVEYRVHAPDASRTAYAGYYLADHLGYQVGAYRGALAHRTLAHLRPSVRFRLA